MNAFYAIFMGILQGLTEFLPVSSSGHLVLAQIILGIEEAGLAFDVSLHMGTLLAILVYFRRDFLLMAKAFLNFRDQSEEMADLRKLGIYICLATLPAVCAALLLGDLAENYLRQSIVVAFTLAGGGLLLLMAEKKGDHIRHFKSITLKDAMIIGFSQALALVPGVSRSGITMTAGLFVGLNRQAVARFSFLLSAPIILGAGVHEIPDIIQQGQSPEKLFFYLTGFVVSAIIGYLVIAVLLKFLRTRTFEIFAYYRILVSGLIFLALAQGW